jgi:hypothetical protein
MSLGSVVKAVVQHVTKNVIKEFVFASLRLSCNNTVRKEIQESRQHVNFFITV